KEGAPNMQLSISLPAPTAPDPAPAANSSLQGLSDDTPGSGQNPPDSFSQFLPPPAQDKPSADASKPSKPTAAQEEAAAALSASLLVSLTHHQAPSVPADLVPAGGKGTAAEATVAAAATGQGTGAALAAGTALSGEAAALAARAKGGATVPAQAAPAKAQSVSPPTAANPPAAAPAAPSAATVATQALTGLAALPSTEQAARAAAVGSGAKIAAPPPKNPGAVSAPSQAASKKFLSSGDKEVADSSQPLGTAVAKVTSAMPTLTTPERPTSAQPAFAVAAQGASSAGTTTDQAPAQADVTGTARGAVEAAMTAAEMLHSGATQQSMSMQFSMGDAELNLRVEMKNGEVQATFSTNSAQLRSDLASEWQSTAAGNSQSSLHQVQPVFTSSGTGGTLSSGEYAQQQGRGGNAGSEPRFSPSSGSSAPSSPSYGSSADTMEANAVPAAAAAGSLYLQTFA
ncbi:MAG TPA: hypothetical protein VIJ19_08200, partial [Opitutaceae bacterium]